jgi:predicted HTH domain antitoxin
MAFFCPLVQKDILCYTPTMKTIQLALNVPDMLDTTEVDLRGMLASKLYESQILSLGQAAVVAGFSKRAFAEVLSRYGVSLFSQTEEELRSDIANA